MNLPHQIANLSRHLDTAEAAANHHGMQKLLPFLCIWLRCCLLIASDYFVAKLDGVANRL